MAAEETMTKALLDEPTEAMIEAASEAIHDFLDERFPEGAMPGGQQLFADDHLDAEFKHEAGCDALATVALNAALRSSAPQEPDDALVERALALREACRIGVEERGVMPDYVDACVALKALAPQLLDAITTLLERERRKDAILAEAAERLHLLALAEGHDTLMWRVNMRIFNEARAVLTGEAKV